MTYLEIVNNVLRRMREDTVTSVASSDYSKMVGDFVNDAHKLVQQSYDWDGLRQTFTLNTVDGTETYTLTGSNQDLTELYVMNNTQNIWLRYIPQAKMAAFKNFRDPEQGSPQYYTYAGLASGDTVLEIYPVPDGVYTLKYTAVIRSNELVNDEDVMTVPTAPVIHLAIALLARERGETGGTSTQEYFSIADRFLAEAIAYDSAKHPEENVYRTV